MYIIENKLKNDKDIYDLYESLDWNKYIRKSNEELLEIMEGSFYVVYVYDEDRLIGTGRMISDGVLTSLICGVGVAPAYQNKGIGKMIIENILEFGKSKNLFVELTCVENLEAYYNKFGLRKYAIAMK